MVQDRGSGGNCLVVVTLSTDGVQGGPLEERWGFHSTYRQDVDSLNYVTEETYRMCERKA